jgi:hypothetical protein
VSNATRGGIDPSAGFPVVYGSSRQSLGRSLPWCAQLQFDLAALGEPLRAFWRNPDRLRDDFRALQEFRRLVTVAVRDRERNRWWNALGQHSSLGTYRELKAGPSALQLEDYLCAPHGGWNDRTLLGRRALTRLRSGTSELRISTGRWTALPAAERQCLQCAAAVETEEHFLLDCALFSDERRELIRSLDRMGREHLATVVKAGNARPAALVPWVMSKLSRPEQFRVLTGCGLSRGSTFEPLRRRVLGKVLAEVAAWIRMRKLVQEAWQQQSSDVEEPQEDE